MYMLGFYVKLPFKWFPRILKYLNPLFYSPITHTHTPKQNSQGARAKVWSVLVGTDFGNGYMSYMGGQKDMYIWWISNRESRWSMDSCVSGTWYLTYVDCVRSSWFGFGFQYQIIPVWCFNPFGVWTLYTEDIWTLMGHLVHHSEDSTDHDMLLALRFPKGW